MLETMRKTVAANDKAASGAAELSNELRRRLRQAEDERDEARRGLRAAQVRPQGKAGFLVLKQCRFFLSFFLSFFLFFLSYFL